MGEQVEVLEDETDLLAQSTDQALLLAQRAAAVDLDVAHADVAAGGDFQKVQATQEGGLA
ncbi:hypothetical protein D3C80_1855840 [compost metagenome]